MNQNADETNILKEIRNSPIPVLLDFWAPWCTTCKALDPILSNISTEFEGRVKLYSVDISKQQSLASNYQIRSVPCIMILKNGRVLKQIVGLKTNAELSTILSDILEDAKA
jgi:thioredoxin